MFASPWIAALVAIFAWWFSTGMILLAVRRADRANALHHGRLAVLSLPLVALGVAGSLLSAATLNAANVYVAFISVLLIWGWIEMAFLLGVITGPERRSCPANLVGWPRFVRAWRTVSYHEVLLFVGLLMMAAMTFGSENTFGFWAYLVLFAARISAKLNLFFGVPRINTEFVPKQLQHLTSYFRQGDATIAFVFGVTFLSLIAVIFGARLHAAETTPAIIGYTLLTALSALAALEHWLMVIPLPDAKLWRWMLPALPSTSKTGQSHEL